MFYKLFRASCVSFSVAPFVVIARLSIDLIKAWNSGVTSDDCQGESN
jgi:hypothetical protein